MGLDENSTVKIGYVIDSYEDKQGVTRTTNKIINFQETNDQPTQTSQTEKSSNGEANRGSQRGSGSVGGRNFDQEGYEKCLWNFFVKVSQGNLEEFGEAMVQGVPWDAFQAIKVESKKRFSPLRQAVQRHAPKVAGVPETEVDRLDELPTIQVEEPHDVDVSDIPFE